MDTFPLISILIPVRNEEANLPRLFNSLDNLDYPTNRLQILLGNDSSEDKSGVLMENYAESRPWVIVLGLENNQSSVLKGKTRVLNDLASKATGQYLFFTDADIALPSRWIKGMLAEFQAGSNIGVVVGVTGFENYSLWSSMQGIEWLMALTIFKISADFKQPSTGLGNNMAVSRAAYMKIGGYEKIGFSIVEDFLLYDQIIKAGFGFKHSFSPDVLAYTVPPERYFEQRKRWIKGAMSARPWAMLPAILQALFLPVLAVIGFFDLELALLTFLVVFSVYGLLIVYFEKKIKVSGYLKYLIPFSIYISVSWLMQFVYHIFKKETVWKGRKY